jgi:hypothetical protein
METGIPEGKAKGIMQLWNARKCFGDIPILREALPLLVPPAIFLLLLAVARAFARLRDALGCGPPGHRRTRRVLLV